MKPSNMIEVPDSNDPSLRVQASEEDSQRKTLGRIGSIEHVKHISQRSAGVAQVLVH